MVGAVFMGQKTHVGSVINKRIANNVFAGVCAGLAIGFVEIMQKTTEFDLT
jgi:hypothetical protein